MQTFQNEYTCLTAATVSLQCECNYYRLEEPYIAFRPSHVGRECGFWLYFPKPERIWMKPGI